MKKVIKELYSLKGAKVGTQVDELRTQLGLAPAGETSSEFVEHALATAANDFLVASGSGAFVKQTLAETKTTLGLGTAAYTAATAYVAQSLATAANDFIVASGSGAFIKKTVEETRTLLLKVYAAQESISSGGSETTLSVDKYFSWISTDSAGDNFILPDGTKTGQLKKIMMKADGGDSAGDGEGAVIGTFPGEQDRLVFNNTGEYALLQWDGTQWIALELASMLDTTNAPAFAS